MSDLLVAVLLGLLFAAPSIVCAVLAYWIWNVAKELREEVKTPSGDPIGQVAERTHDIAAVNQAQLVIQGQKLTDSKLDMLHGLTDDCYKQVLRALEILEQRGER